MQKLATLLACASAAEAFTADLSAPAVPVSFVTEINSIKGLSWKAGLNEGKFQNMTLGQAKSLMGALRDPVRRAKLPVVLEESAVPATFNSTSHWPQCGGVIGHARDQSDCGCCWAFGSTESFNDRLCIKTNSTTLLSPQDTCSCCNSAHGCQSGGCDGGYTEDAFNYFMKYGLVTGGDNPSVGNGASCFPYQLKECGHHEASPLIPCPQVCSPGECATPKCPTACTEKSYTTAWTADKHKAAKGAYRLGSVAAAQADIMKNGPISAAFTVYADFLTYTSGVYKHTTGAELGGHAIKILGWGTEGGQDYWLAMNSWNQYWGDFGYFKIARGTDECGIEDDMVTGLP